MARARQFKWKEKKFPVLFEAVTDADLWISVCHFKKPGSLNDVNVPDYSPFVVGILQGTLLPNFGYVVNSGLRRDLYFLVNGIYPRWSIFISSIQEGRNRKK